MLQFHPIVCTKCGHKFMTSSGGGIIYMPHTPNMTCPKCGHKNGTIGKLLGWLEKRK